MYKILLAVAGLLLLCASSALSEEAATTTDMPETTEEAPTPDYCAEAESLLKQGLKKHHSELKDIAFHLSDTEKVYLYNSFVMYSGGAIAFNWVPGFGTGSFSQGDGFGAGIILTADILTCGGLTAGVVGALAGIVVAVFEAIPAAIADSDMDSTEACFRFAGTAFAASGILWVCTRVFGTIRPIAYKKHYNALLRSSLGITGTIEVAPVVKPSKQEYGVVATIKL